jgi:hypothetical protein
MHCPQAAWESCTHSVPISVAVLPIARPPTSFIKTIKDFSFDAALKVAEIELRPVGIMIVGNDGRYPHAIFSNPYQ